MFLQERQAMKYFIIYLVWYCYCLCHRLVN